MSEEFTSSKFCANSRFSAKTFSGAEIGVFGLPKSPMNRLWLLLSMVAFVILCPITASAQAQTSESGLPLPRFASLKSDQVNIRKGPGKEYPIDWVFRRAGLPVEIIKEYGHWRQIRDFQGSVGWVFHALLSGRRTMVVLPWEIKAGNKPAGKVLMTPIYEEASRKSDVLVNVEPGVIGSVLNCDRKWCNVSVMNYRGWILQKTLWGVYEPEIIK